MATQHEQLKIQVAGAEIDDVYDDLVRVEVELDEELAGMFRLTLALLLRADGTWSYLDDDRFTVWQPVVVSAGLGDDSRQLISGYITHVRPDFGAGLGECTLEIWGMDASVLLDREDRLKDWPNRKDSDIASEIFGTYGLTPDVRDTNVIHDEQVSTVIQRETDMQFLKRLALRNGYECFVDGDTGYFGPPGLAATPQPTLAVHFGEETNVNYLRLEVNALTPADVAMFQVDRASKEVLAASSQAGQQTVLGSRPASGYVIGGIPTAKVFVASTVTTGNLEMTALVQGLYDRGEWFITGEGEVAANQYGNILSPRGVVTIKGIGGTFSGVYYVTHISHVFTGDGYTQLFRVKRNALQPSGSESFGATAAAALGGIG